jgi:F-type H+-transporting ATPase subunit b
MATDASGAVTAAPGMPQLDFSTFPNQIFWLVITLVVIYMILTRVALPRIGAVLAERQGTITNDLAAAEDLKRQALEAEHAYDKALADARTQAQAIVDEARAEMQADLAEATAHANAEIAAQAAESATRIDAIREGSLASIEEIARDTAAEIVAVMGSGTKVDTDAIAAAVAERLKG